MQDQTCETCRHAKFTRYYGSCHRYPPFQGNWQPINPTDWCGEYEERPEEEQQDKEA